MSDRTSQEERQLQKRIEICPSYEEATSLLRRYRYEKSHNVKGQTKLTNLEKKKIKIYLENQIDTRSSILMGWVAREVKRMRSTNKNRSAIDDLLEIDKIFGVDGDWIHQFSFELKDKLVIEIGKRIESWDQDVESEKQRLRKRKSWGGVK
jgi:hypothetical protein|tara:strand:+ start:884 stop:1336 length:453 start_codon:yes stop_codon:yes gene_type:complete